MSSKLREENGVTLVEVMIALVILLLVFVGLIQASLLAIGTNARNQARDEAVMVAAEYMTQTRALPFMDARLTPQPAGPPAGCAADPADWTLYPNPPLPAPVPVPPLSAPVRTFGNLTVRYTVRMCVSDLDSENKQVGITVNWTDARSGETLRHTLLTNMRNK